MSFARPFHVGRNVRLFYALAVAREFTPMLAVWVVYLTDFRDLTLTQVGIMEGMFWTVKVGLELPSGAFADRFGRRTTFMTGIGLEAAGTAVFAFAGDFTLLVVSYVIWSSGLAFRSGNDEAYLYDTLSSARREHEYSDRIGVYLALGTVSILAGGLAGGVLAEVTNLQIAILAALVPFALAVPVIALMEEPPQHRHARTMSVAQTLRTGVAAVWHDRQVRSIILLQMALSGVFPAFFLLSQPFFDAHGVPLALFGVLLIPVYLARTGAGLISGRLTRRIGLPSTLALSVAGSVAGLSCLATIDSVWAFAGIAVANASVAIALPAIGAYVNERTESHVRATVLSVAPMGTSIMIGAMSVLAGAVAAQSLRLSFGAVALVTLLFAGASFTAWLAAHGAAPRREIEPAEA
jgi:MFS family permease